MRPRLGFGRPEEEAAAVDMATPTPADGRELVHDVIAALAEALLLTPETQASLDRSSPLFGQLPELDSMAVATVLTALEDRFGILIDDEDVSAEMFATVGALADFVAARMAAPDSSKSL
jgi:acyl carrier protein